MDDPTQDGAGNVVDDNDAEGIWNGDDNRGPPDSAPELKLLSPETPPPLLATDDVRVLSLVYEVPLDPQGGRTMYPGNNWKVLATTDSDWDENVEVDPALENGRDECNSFRHKLRPQDKPPADWSSPLLSLWRKLHIEFDAMRAPDGQEPFGIVSGTSSRITPFAVMAQSSLGCATASLIGGVLDPESASQGISVDYVNHNTWEVLGNGDVEVLAKTVYDTDKFDTGPPPADDPSEVYLLTPEDPSNKPFGVNTDDPKWRTDLPVPQPSDVLPGMNYYFHPAYIDCVELTEGNSNAEFGWQRMTSNQLAHVDVTGGPEYWTACVGWGYESGYRKFDRCGACTDHSFYAGDGDPEHEGVSPGYSGSLLGRASRSEGRCMVWVENARDCGNRSVARIAVHEVGHLLGLHHADYDGSWTTWEPDPDEDGIMGWEKPDAMSCHKQWYDLTQPSPNRFSYANLKYLRESATD